MHLNLGGWVEVEQRPETCMSDVMNNLNKVILGGQLCQLLSFLDSKNFILIFISNFKLPVLTFPDFGVKGFDDNNMLLIFLLARRKGKLGF